MPLITFASSAISKLIPACDFKTHLPVQELARFLVASLRNSHQIPDNTATCKLCATFLNSREESNFWYLRHLSEPDWPTFCQRCNCMSSFLPLRNSDKQFCKQATLAKNAAPGFFPVSRFSYYPGHLMRHFYSVGKWPVLSLLRLKKQDFTHVAQLFVEYNRALGIMSLIISPELNPPIILHILSFLPADFRCKGSFFSSYTIRLQPASALRHVKDREGFLPVLGDILELNLGNQTRVARKVLLLYAKSRIREHSDRFSIASRT